MRNIITRAAACIVCLSVISPVFATNGYFAHGYGTKNKGLAGGGVALPQDAMIAATNPAGMAFVGDRKDLGVALFSPSPRGYESTMGAGGLFPDSADSDSDYFLIPHFAKNWVLDQDSTAGLTIYGNGGMNTNYSGSAGGGFGIFGDGATGVNLAQLFVNGTYARKINPTSSFGVSAILVYQKFSAKGLANFEPLSSDPNHVSRNGDATSTGYGLKLGWQGEVSPGFTLGASYQSKMAMSEFKKYAGLFAEAGDFDIPATWTVGLAFKPNSTSTVVFDVQKIMYSQIASVSNPLLPALGACMFGDATQCLGTDNGPGFGWEDMTVYKLGYQWSMPSMPGWVWRAGYSKGDQPIPKEEILFNILAPAVIEQHVTFGFTRDLGNSQEFNFAFMYGLHNKISGPDPFGGPGKLSIEMSQWEIEGSYSW